MSVEGTGFAHPGWPPSRALQWGQALDLLDTQIHALPHEPDIQHELYVLWEMLVRLRREDTSP
jgi:hypothetical protein